MSDFIGSVWWMIVSLGVLVTFHEFGHYWVARRCGVKCCASRWASASRCGCAANREGTEFAIAAIPLGGYVKMLDEREGDVPAAERAHAFNNKTVWQRIAIVAAGPAANLILCVALLWAMFVIGKQDYSATVGRAEGLAAQAQLHPGDRNRQGRRPHHRHLGRCADGADHCRYRPPGCAPGSGHRRGRASDPYPAAVAIAGHHRRARCPRIGRLTWQFTLRPTFVNDVIEGSPAAGTLRKGDRLLAIDGTPVTSPAHVGPLVQTLGKRGGTGMIEIERDGARYALELAPRLSTDPATPGNGNWASLRAVNRRLRRPPPIRPAGRGPGRVARNLADGGRFAGHDGTDAHRQASIKNISGPVTIARAANESAQRGLDWFLFFSWPWCR